MLSRMTAGSTGFRRRKLIYRLALFGGVPSVAFCWVLVMLGVLPPTPTDDVIVGVILPVLFVPFVAFWDDPGETRTRRQRFYEFGFSWLFMSAIAQTFWELPWFFLDLTGLIHGAGPEDTLFWPWWSYAVADTRYLTSNPSIAAIEFCAGFAGPFELYACWLLHKGKRLQGNWWALLIGFGLSWGAVIFFVAEIHVGFENIGDGAWGFWGKWVGLNLPWTLSPLGFIPASVMELQEIYEKRGVEKYLAAKERGEDPPFEVEAAQAAE